MSATEARLARLRPEHAHRVRERAAIIYYGRPEGTITWPEADEMAYAQERAHQYALPVSGDI